MIPGLWDMHVHSAFVSPAWDEKVIYPLYIANGVTGVRDMGGDPDVLERRRSRIESGELLGPHLIFAGPFLAGGKSDQQTIAVNTPEEARRAVDTVKKQGLDFVKILSNVPRDSYFAIADESAKQKIPFVGHVPYSVSVREASAAGQKSIEHLTGILLACSSREDELRAQGLTALANRDYCGLPETRRPGHDHLRSGQGARACFCKWRRAIPGRCRRWSGPRPIAGSTIPIWKTIRV